jgi:hypothetical protein
LLKSKTSLENYLRDGNSSPTINVALTQHLAQCFVLHWANDQAQRPNRTSGGAKEAAK